MKAADICLVSWRWSVIGKFKWIADWRWRGAPIYFRLKDLDREERFLGRHLTKMRRAITVIDCFRSNV